MSGFDHKKETLAKLGKYKSSKGCLYIKKLSDVDDKILDKLISDSVRQLQKNSG